MDTDHTQGSWKIDPVLPPDLLWRLHHPKFATHPAHGTGFVSLATPENVADMKEAAAEIERLRNELEVSEACNKAKTILILEIQDLIRKRTGPPRSNNTPQDLREYIASLDQQSTPQSFVEAKKERDDGWPGI